MPLVRPRSSICLLAAVGLLLGGCTSFYPEKGNLVYQEVFYLTTRDASGMSNPAKWYTNRRGKATFGMAMVAIDAAEDLSGFAQAQANRILKQERLLYNQQLQQVVPSSGKQFIKGFHQYEDAMAGPAEVLVFIHGYRRTFADCVINAAELRYQLAFPGPVVAFAWPSTESVSGYIADQQNMEWSTPRLKEMLEEMAAELPHARIHLVAHSMGSRALLSVLEAIHNGQSSLQDHHLGEIIFLAPDLDRENFLRDVAPWLSQTGFDMTLYVSSEDFPLMASASLFQYPRLGDARQGVPVVRGMETIDVSEAITILDGHGYYESDRDTIEDLYHLIRKGEQAGDRPNLEKVDGPGGPYWRLLPNEPN